MLLSLAAAFQGCQSGGEDGHGYTTEECADACNKVAAANCGDVGSSCVSTCLSYPNAQYLGDCQVQLKAYFDCWWQAEAYLCNSDSETTPVGCDTQRGTYLSCSGETDAGGAGGSDAGGAGGSAGAPDDAAAGAGGASEIAGAAGAGETTGGAGMAGATG